MMEILPVFDVRVPASVTNKLFAGPAITLLGVSSPAVRTDDVCADTDAPKTRIVKNAKNEPNFICTFPPKSYLGR
jgi:hypothetical protein